MSERPPFHLAFPVVDLESTRNFYGGLLGCREGRSAEGWVDFDLCGHQISAHVRPEECAAARANDVDGDDVPVRHFGLVLPWDEWHRLRDRLVAAQADFLLAPKVRFVGEPGEQATMFVRDPSNNALEFKSFQDPRRLFAKE